MRSTFVVGCGQFINSSIRSLSYALNDAREFYEVITDNKLGDADRESSILLQNPQREDLLRKMGSFLEKLKPQDEFIIYFAGHGWRLPSGQWAFLCNDSNPKSAALTTFAYSDLKRLISGKDRKRGILIFDTCFARSADSVLRGLRERGEFAGIQPEPPQEGIVTIWACGAAELTFEKSGHGLLSAWLLKAIRGGADLGPNIEFLGAGDAVSWIRTQLAAAHMAEPLWPSFRAAGGTAQLYLSRNPAYTKAAEGSSHNEQAYPDLADVTRLLVRDLGLESKDRSPISVARELGELAQEYFENGEVSENTTVLTASRARVLGYLTTPLFISLALGVGLANFLSIFGIAIGLACFILFLRSEKDAWSILQHGSQAYFFLINEWGFVHLKMVNEQACWIAIPWSILTRTQEKFDRGGRKLTLEIRFPYGSSHKPFLSPNTSITEFSRNFNEIGGKLQFSSMEVFSRGGFEALRNGIDQGRRQLDRQRITLNKQSSGKPFSAFRKLLNPGPRKAATSTSRTFLLVGVSEYAHLPALKAPTKDVEKLFSLFGHSDSASVEKVIDADLTTFERVLAALSARASGGVGIFYFTGHGIVSHGEFYLGLSSTDPAHLEETAFPIASLAEFFLESRLRHFVIILDCCLSGNAGEGLELTPLALHSFDEFWSKDKEGISLLAATAPSEYAYEFETGAVFTAALVGAIDEIQKRGSGSVTLGAINQLTTKYLRDNDLPQHHNCFIGAIGASLILIPEQRRTSEGDLRKELAFELNDLERKQIADLTAAAEELQNAAQRGMERLIIRDGTAIATTPGPSRPFYGCMGLAGALCSSIVFLTAAHGVWDNQFTGNGTFTFLILLLVCLGAGLFFVGCCVMFVEALWPRRKDRFIVLHPNGIFDSEGLMLPGSSITGTYLSRSEDRFENEFCINLQLRDGTDRTIMSSTVYRKTNIPQFFEFVQAYVNYYRSSYDINARKRLEQTLEKSSFLKSL